MTKTIPETLKIFLTKRWKLLSILLFCLFVIYRCSINHEYNELMEKALAEKEAHSEMKVFDGEVEPPVPNFNENNSTLLGVDSNHNGLRDDVEIWINRTFKDQNVRLAFKAKHRNDQKIMLNRYDVNSLFQVEYNASKCSETFFNSYKEHEEYERKINTLIRNTRQRRVQYNMARDKVTSAIGGWSMTRDKAQKEYCDFLKYSKEQ